MDLDVPKNDWTFPSKGAIESEERVYYHCMTKKHVEEKLKKNGNMSCGRKRKRLNIEVDKNN